MMTAPIRALVLGLALLWSGTAGAQSASSADMRLEQGRLLYAKRCAVCHGIVMEGMTLPHPEKAGKLAVPALDESGKTWRYPDSVLYGLVRYGDHILASKVSAWKMPAFRYSLSEAETWIVIDYIKSY